MKIRALVPFSTGTITMEQYEVKEVTDALGNELIAAGVAVEIGGGLPPVTASDNGKVLTANNGVWGAQEPIGKKFIVTLTPTAADYSGTMDKTVAEINAAYEAGQEIWFKVLTSASTSVEVPIAYWANDSSYDYHGFAADIVQVNANMFIVAYVGSISDGTRQTYDTKVYALTPAT